MKLRVIESPDLLISNALDKTASSELSVRAI